MENTALGRTGHRISRLSLGGCPLGGHGWGVCDDTQAVASVRAALESGVNFFDTADIYGFGHSEELLSQALGEDRHSVIIASKFGIRYDPSSEKTYKDISPQYVREALIGSLKRLRLDSIPLYYIHWPDGVTPIQDTVAEMEKCRQEGLIGGIGLSNCSTEEIEKALEVTSIDAVQVQCNLIDRAIAHPLFEVVAKHGIVLVTWGSLAQGLLTGKYDEKSRFETNDRRSRETYPNFHGEKFKENMKVVRLLQEIAVETGKTPAQIAIRWLLDTQSIGSVLFGAKNVGQVDDNAAATGWRLSDEHYEWLNRTNVIRFSMQYQSLNSFSIQFKSH